MLKHMAAIQHKTYNICCHIAKFTIHLVTTGNPMNSCLTSTVDKTQYGSIITFSVQILKCLLHLF